MPCYGGAEDDLRLADSFFQRQDKRSIMLWKERLANVLALSSLFLLEPLTLSNIFFASAVLIIVAIGKRMPVAKVKKLSN